ncbi:condensation domain-containing protein [Streptomyces sp. NPDC056004]|uniref:condensation domain-containing protein n=1 Tax=Streptomyces sp. NPDC056004 TaxID=3345677 RepID=UPI0035DC2F34
MLDEKHPSELGVFNIGREIPIPQGCRAEIVVDAIALAMEQFEALRTRFSPSPDQLQTLSSKGALPILAIEIDADEHESLNEYIDHWRRKQFGDEFSLRVAMVIERDSVRHLFLVYNHMTIDGTSAGLIDAAIRDGIGGVGVHSNPISHSMHPFEIQEYEHSQLGKARSARAAEHWANVLRQIPGTAFSPRVDRDSRPTQSTHGPQRIIQATYNSATLPHSQAQAAQRLGVSQPSIVAAAFFSLISVLTSNHYVTLQILCSNRLSRELQNSVTNLAQNAVALIDCSGATFDTIAKRVSSAALRAYRHGRYDPRIEDALMREVRSERGIHVTRDSCMFNYIDAIGDLPVAEFEPLGQVNWLDSSSRWTSPPLKFNILSARSMVQLRIEADDAYLSRADVELLLQGVERICAEVATRDIEISEIVDMCEISPMVRSDEWIYRDRTYIDTSSTQNLLDEIPGVRSASLAIEEGFGGDPGIACSIYAENEKITARYVHSKIVDRLHSFPNGSAPTWYDVYLAGRNGKRLLDSGSGRGDGRPGPS